MTEDTIARLISRLGLGTFLPPIVPVPGGYQHRVYRVCTEKGIYAVKYINPNILKRTDAMSNFRRAETLEQTLEDARIPIVPALVINGKKMQAFEGSYFYIFRWQNGSITDWRHITSEQCRTAGNLQGRIHAISPRNMENTTPDLSSIEWEACIEQALFGNTDIGILLNENKALLNHAQNSLNQSRASLPGISCITFEDMDPKNVMWDSDRPFLIDLEDLNYGSPVSSALQLSLQWAGITTLDLDFNKLKSFFDGYLSAYDNGFRDYADIFGLAYTWIEWFHYNIQRALGECADEAERESAISQVKHTVAIIRYLYDMENRIRKYLNTFFHKPSEEV